MTDVTDELVRYFAVILLVTCSQHAFAESVKTPQGDLAVQDRVVTIAGRSIPNLPPANAGIYIEKTYVYPSQTDVLLQYAGGSACPARYRWLVVTDSIVGVSPEFGTCSDLITITKQQSEITVEAPAFRSGTAGRFAYDGITLTSVNIDSSGRESQAKTERGAILRDNRRTNLNLPPVSIPEATAGGASKSTLATTRAPDSQPRPKAQQGNSSHEPRQNSAPRVDYSIKPGGGTGFFVLSLNDFDAGGMATAAVMTGCPVEAKPSIIINSKGAGPIQIDEYVFPHGCFGDKTTAPTYGVGILAPTDRSYAMGFAYRKGKRVEVINYIKNQ